MARISQHRVACLSKRLAELSLARCGEQPIGPHVEKHSNAQEIS
jgi:hypothetical protein